MLNVGRLVQAAFPAPGPRQEASLAWRGSALFILAACVLFLVAGIPSVQERLGWGTLMVFAVSWLLGAIGLVLWSAAVVLAALGRGRLHKSVLALGALVFLAAGTVSALSLTVTSEPGIVLCVAVACTVGLAASAVAWARAAP